MTELGDRWERRALSAQRRLSGVLFRGLPELANRRLHQWHTWVVLNIFATRLGNSACVLDLGCGYGRLSDELQSHRPDLRMFGQDLSPTYAALYAETGRAAVVADHSLLPFNDGAFDGVLAVTTLMYSTEKARVLATMEIRRVLRPGGHALLVDPGNEMQEFLERLMPSRKVASSGGAGFRCDEYVQLVESAGLFPVLKGGNPAFLFMLAATIGTARPQRLAEALCRFDLRRAGYSPLALHRWILVKSPPGDVNHDIEILR